SRLEQSWKNRSRSSEKPRATRQTGEAGASCGAGRARRATLEVRRIDSDIEKSARSAERREFSVRETAKVETSVSSPLKRWEFRGPRRASTGEGLEIPAQWARLTRALTVMTCIDSNESMH